MAKHLPVLIESLKQPVCYAHPVHDVTVIETHISYVLLTGAYAYKIKKSLNLGFLDFSTLDKRYYYCCEELRLNRRLAPQVYLDVVPISGPEDRPQVGGAGEAVEYAVKMRQFSQAGMLDHLLEQGLLPLQRMDELAGIVAAFHETLDGASPKDPYGSYDAIRTYALQNFEQIAGASSNDPDGPALAALRDWTVSELRERLTLFERRKAEGFVRECHGDLHLGNIALIDDKLVVFDCIEFNPGLRWIDVMNEAAFLAMDLQARSRGDFAARLLNRYLELTGDYDGIALLRFYLVYRAMVRAKVNWIRSHQDGVKSTARAQASEKYHRYLRLAKQHLDKPEPALIITHGLSGSGKTTLTQPVLEVLGAIRVRSDIERKRLHQLPPEARTRAGIAEGIYSTDAGDRTYNRLEELAAVCLHAGWPVIVDATFLERQRRDGFRRLAEEYDAPFLILEFRASETALQARVRARSVAASDASDADLAVLQHQIVHYEPLSGSEAAYTVSIDTESMSGDAAAVQVQKLLAA